MDLPPADTSGKSRARDLFLVYLFICGAIFIIHPSTAILTYTALTIIGLFVIFIPFVAGGYGLHRIYNRL